jgi:hypothetical protein
MQGVFPAAFAVLVELQAIGVITTVFLAGVVALLALGAGKVDHHTNILLWHDILFRFGMFV